MSEMVERAAKVALAELLPAVSWGECSQGTRDDFLRASRAALSAALDPEDEALCVKVREAWNEATWTGANAGKCVIATIRAMALGEQKP